MKLDSIILKCRKLLRKSCQFPKISKIKTLSSSASTNQSRSTDFSVEKYGMVVNHLPYRDMGKLVSMADLDFPWEVRLTDGQRQHFQKVKAEYVLWKNADSSIPHSDLLDEDLWVNIINEPHAGARLTLYTFLANKAVVHGRSSEKSQQNVNNRILRRKLSKNILDSTVDNPDDDYIDFDQQRRNEPLRYAYGFNFIMQRVERTSIVKWNFSREPLIRAFQPTIVFDLNMMKLLAMTRDINLTIKQLRLSYMENLSHRSPFNLVFANMNPVAPYQRELRKHFNSAEGLDGMPYCQTTEGSVRQSVGSDRRIIYLTPDAPQSMQSFDSEAVYVIGAMVDKTPSQRFATVGEAKRLQVEYQKLPLDVYLNWCSGHKCLALNHVLKILLDVHMTGDFRSALLATVPNRRLIPTPASRTERRRTCLEQGTERKTFLMALSLTIFPPN